MTISRRAFLRSSVGVAAACAAPALAGGTSGRFLIEDYFARGAELYDPINHAVVARDVNTGGLVWRYFDRLMDGDTICVTPDPTKGIEFDVSEFNEICYQPPMPILSV